MSESWEISGEYMEACSCEFLCPCITRNATTPATNDFCRVAMTFAISEGHFGDTPLAGVTFSAVAESPAIMADGDWKLGLIIDESATDAQAEAVAAIASGAAGGPMAAFGELVSEFRGVERAPIGFEVDDLDRRVSVPGLLEQAVSGVPSVAAEGACIAVDNTFHPANARLNLATAARNMMKVFGIEWHDDGGSNNGHFAPFHWRS